MNINLIKNEKKKKESRDVCGIVTISMKETTRIKCMKGYESGGGDNSYGGQTTSSKKGLEEQGMVDKQGLKRMKWITDLSLVV